MGESEQHNDHTENEHPTSALLEKVVDHHQHDTISIGEIKNAMHERGFGVLMAIAALPLCLPIPAPPGYTTFFSIPLFLFSLQMIWGRDSPWIPKWIARRQIKRKTLAHLVEKAAPMLRKIERLLRARLYFASSATGERLIGIVAFICSLSIAVPLPLTNLPPGYGILIMSLGLLGKDGVTILIGMAVGLLGVGITMGILIAGQTAVLSLLGGAAPVVVVPPEGVVLP